jgi:hypothetical protein
LIPLSCVFGQGKPHILGFKTYVFFDLVKIFGRIKAFFALKPVVNTETGKKAGKKTSDK